MTGRFRPIRDTEARFPNGIILTYSGQSILGDHLEASTPPKISQARGPPLWDASDAAQIEVYDTGSDWSIEQQISPDELFDQSVNWYKSRVMVFDPPWSGFCRWILRL